MSDLFILEGKIPKKVEDVIEWGKAWKVTKRRVAETTVSRGAYVSTVFLGIDHSYDGGPPKLFETMVFGGKHAGDCWRYSTWEEAEAGHAVAVAKVCGK